MSGADSHGQTVYAVTLVRHGRTAYNAAGKLQGQVDIPLNDTGLWQADRTAQALYERYVKGRGRTPIVVSSPLERACQTAERFAQLAGVQVSVDERVKERSFGEWEGCRWHVETLPRRRNAPWRRSEGVGGAAWRACRGGLGDPCRAGP